MTQHRIVIIDGHVIAQRRSEEGWWTCMLPGQKFAVWEDTRKNRFEARSRFGNMPVVECDLKPSAPKSTRFYNEELRRMARSI